MSLYFRATGDAFDVDAFLAVSSLVPDDVFQCGQPGLVLQAKPCSGFFIQITNGFGRLDDHTNAAIDFLRQHRSELARLSQYPGVTVRRLDFGYERDPRAAIQCDYLPPTLLNLAGSLGIGIELSLYPASEDAEVDETGGANVG